MATLENGYTRVANEILENIPKLKLNGTQCGIIAIVWRYTYGFQRKEHDLSLSFISEATGYDKRQVQRELKRLEEKNVIIQNIKSGSYRKISFNKDFDSWIFGKSTIGESTIGETTIGETTKTTIGESTNKNIGESTNQERKKENFKESSGNSLEAEKPKPKSNDKNSDAYKEIIDYLNLKAGTRFKPSTKETQKYINARLSESYTVEDFKTVIDVKVDDWLNDSKMSKYLTPKTLFRPANFENYLNQEKSQNDTGSFIDNGDGSFSLR